MAYYRRYSRFNSAYYRTKKLANNMGRALKRYKMFTYIVGGLMFFVFLVIAKQKNEQKKQR